MVPGQIQTVTHPMGTLRLANPLKSLMIQRLARQIGSKGLTFTLLLQISGPSGQPRRDGAACTWPGKDPSNMRHDARSPELPMCISRF
jgi:hypothetical protein